MWLTTASIYERHLYQGLMLILSEISDDCQYFQMTGYHKINITHVSQLMIMKYLIWTKSLRGPTSTRGPFGPLDFVLCVLRSHTQWNLPISRNNVGSASKFLGLLGFVSIWKRFPCPSMLKMPGSCVGT